MLKQLILLIVVAVTSACSLNEDAAAVNHRRVKYKVSTIMPNVELVVNYFVKENEKKSVVIDKFPWEVETYISPYTKIGMEGYMRYKDESIQIHKYIEMKLMVDVGSPHLNQGDTIFIESMEAGVTNADLIKNTKFDILIDPLK